MQRTSNASPLWAPLKNLRLHFLSKIFCQVSEFCLCLISSSRLLPNYNKALGGQAQESTALGECLSPASRSLTLRSHWFLPSRSS